MRKLKVPSAVTISILTLITVVFWIIFSVARLLISKPPASISQEVLKPLSVELDKETLEGLQQRIDFSQP